MANIVVLYIIRKIGIQNLQSIGYKCKNKIKKKIIIITKQQKPTTTKDWGTWTNLLLSYHFDSIALLLPTAPHQRPSDMQHQS